jgi:hypothetical protein
MSIFSHLDSRLTTLRGIIQEAALPDSKNEHPWICYTFNEKRERSISLLSPDEYKELSSKNSFFGAPHCIKIPLIKIIAIANQFDIHNPFASNFNFEFVGKLSDGNAFSTDLQVESLIENAIRKIEKEHDDISKAITALDTMCKKSRAKKETLKTQGIWTRIKLFIYSLFNKSPDVEDLKKNLPTKKSPEFLKKEFCTKAEKKLRERIALNIEDFIENLPESKKREQDKSKDWDKVIKEPKDVKKWLAFYAEDKIPREQLSSEAVNNQRVRIGTLCKLWQDFQAYSQSIAQC